MNPPAVRPVLCRDAQKQGVCGNCLMLNSDNSCAWNLDDEPDKVCPFWDYEATWVYDAVLGRKPHLKKRR